MLFQIVKTFFGSFVYPMSSSKWCYLAFHDKYTDRFMITRPGTKDDVIFKSASSAWRQQKTGMRFQHVGHHWVAIDLLLVDPHNQRSDGVAVSSPRVRAAGSLIKISTSNSVHLALSSI